MSAKEERELELLTYFREPHTLREAASSIHQTFDTVWRAVQPLLKDGRLKELAWRQGHQKMYCVNPENNKDGITRVLTSSGYRPVGAFVTNWPVENAACDVRDLIAQAWLYSQFHGAESIDNAKAGRMPLATLKPLMRQALEQLKRSIPVIEQFILSDIWEDPSPKNAEKFGPVDMGMALRCQERLQRRHNK